MASDHKDCVLHQLVDRGRAIRTGKYLLAVRDNDLILLSKDNDETYNNQLLIDFVTKSFRRTGACMKKKESVSMAKLPGATMLRLQRVSLLASERGS